MAEPLKDFFDRPLIRRIGRSVAEVHPGFDEKSFVREASASLASLGLMDRARQIARALAGHLPDDYPEAVRILIASLGPEHERDELVGAGMDPFFYMPHVLFVAEHGLSHFEESMRAQYELTKRFSAESSIRYFIESEPEGTFEQLRKWTEDPNAHVRRLVSEGTRLRLPWAIRVKWLDKNPGRVIELLELLKDDSTTLVRRSVANNLNDMGKVHPDVLADTARRWLTGSPGAERRALIEHALRSAVKRADPAILAILGYGDGATVSVTKVKISPKRVRVGGTVGVAFSLRSGAAKRQDVLVDLVVHFIKANGRPSPKVFKLGRHTLEAKGEARFSKEVSLAVHTTRKPHAGTHLVEAQVNGTRLRVGSFEVTG